MVPQEVGPNLATRGSPCALRAYVGTSTLPMNIPVEISDGFVFELEA